MTQAKHRVVELALCGRLSGVTFIVLVAVDTEMRVLLHREASYDLSRYSTGHTMEAV